jgi:phosphoglucosamine mutase
MGRLFGTDGIRGVANQYPITAEIALETGRVVASVFTQKTDNPKIVIGKDTRISGDMLEHAVAAGICSMGVDVLLAGVMPTPAIAFLTTQVGADGGVVISASHNPFFDNGIKLFNKDGFKLSDDIESRIENMILSGPTGHLCREIQKTGRVTLLENGNQLYMNFLKKSVPGNFSLNGLKIALDCSNGAVYRIAPDLFSGLGAHVKTICNIPDGFNINKNCGSQHTQSLQKFVRDNGADIGLAFDGDGDRLAAVDENGNEIKGDQILFIGAKFLKKQNRLKNNLLVTTVMSNIGLGLALKDSGINHAVSAVGDRYVLELMQKTKGAVLGGEDSGHIIYLDHQTTGDGLLAALKLLEAMTVESKPLSVLARMMTLFPQKLINIDVKEKPDIKTIPEISKEIENVENILGDKGRVLVRYSGTQPQCRVMVEGPTAEETEKYCRRIADAVKAAIGA